MKQLFEIIRGLCASADGIAESDRDNGQLLLPNPPVKFPCALIKLNFRTDQVTKLAQQCKGTVEVTVAYDLMKVETTSLAGQTASDRSLQYMDYGQSVYLKLQGYSTDPVIYINRTGMSDTNINGKQCVKLVFDCGYMDRSAGD